MFEEFISRLALLHSARQRVAENKAKRKELMDTFFAEHAEFFEGMGISLDVAMHIETDVREEALILYKTIPSIEKTGVPGVTIRESKLVGYDPDVALDWAIKHGGIALKLDEAAYRKQVLSGTAPGSVDVVLTVAIGGDLSRFASDDMPDDPEAYYSERAEQRP